MEKQNKQVEVKRNEIKPVKKIEVDLAKVEEEIKEKVFKADGNIWRETYELMDEVDRRQLWRAKYVSWTEWVEHLANSEEAAGTSISMLWQRYRTGKFYSEYKKRLEKFQSKIKVPELGSEGMAITKLDLIASIAKAKNTGAEIDGKLVDDDYVDDLMLKLIQHDKGLTKKKLVEMKRETANRTPRIDAVKKKSDEKKELSARQRRAKLRQEGLKTAVGELRKDHSWLAPKSADRRKNGFYKVLPGLSINDPADGKAVLIDVVVVENLSEKKSEVDESEVHCISYISDAKGLKKLNTLEKISAYGDYFWLLCEGHKVTVEAIKLMEKSNQTGWGLLEVRTSKDKRREGKVIKKVVLKQSSSLMPAKAKLKMVTASLMESNAEVGGKLR